MPYVGNKPEVGNFRKCDAITTSATATYNLLVGGVAVNPNQNQCIVSLNGVMQSSGNSYTIASSQITFASALTSSDVIDFILILGDTLDVGTVSDDTISTAKLQANAVTTAKITDGNVTAAKFNADVISGQTELATTPADTDEFLLSDAGVLKRIDYSHIKSTSLFTQVATGSASSAASLEITSAFSATYTNYMIVLTNWSVGSDATFQFRTGQSDGTYTSGFCFEQRTHVYDDDQNVTSGNNAADITLFNTQRAGAGCYIDGILYVWRPMSAVDTNRGYTWHTHGIRNNSGTAYGYCIGGGASAEANAHTRIKFTPSTGTFTGTATVYGMTNPS